MNGNEYRNMVKTIIIFLAQLLVIIAGLYFAAYYTGAGDTNYQLSLIFVAAQTAVFIITYIIWYCNTNKAAVEMTNIGKMRDAAFISISLYWFIALAITAGIAGLAWAAMVFGIFFDDVNMTYRLASAITGCAVGSITLFLMMRFWGIPDRVLARV